MKPALLHPRVAFFHGRAEDAPSVLTTVINAIITDPPYSEHTHKMLGKERRVDGTAARDVLDFPPLNDSEIEAYADQWVRLTNGWIIVFTDERTLGSWGTAFEKAGGRWVRTGQWVKTNGMPQMTGDRPSAGAEQIVIAHAFPPGKGKMHWYGGGRPAVWRGPVEHKDEHGGLRTHPNQKPLWLMQELVGLFVPPNTTIMDPFSGSGTTGVAALWPHRFDGSTTNPRKPKASPPDSPPEIAPLPKNISFVGIEHDHKYIAATSARLCRALDPEPQNGTQPSP